MIGAISLKKFFNEKLMYALRAFYNSGNFNGPKLSTFFLLGPPGIGKTESILGLENAFPSTKVKVLHRQLSQSNEEEFSGIPKFETKMIFGKETLITRWAVPEIVAEIYEASEENDFVIVFFDDCHTTTFNIWKYVLQLFTSRKIKGYTVPNNVYFILAGNNSDESINSEGQDSTITGRCSLVPVELPFEDWKMDYAIKKNINPKVTSFLSYKSYAKHFIGKQKAEENWESPRMWTYFANLLTEKEKDGDLNVTDLTQLCTYHVGKTAASDFVIFYSLYSEIEAPKIFKKTIKISIPTDFAKRYIYVMATTSEFYALCVDEIKKETKDKKKIEDYVSIYADVIYQTALKDMEIAVAGVYELSLLLKSGDDKNRSLNDIYIKVRMEIKRLNPEISDRFTDSVALIKS
jgi:hypothetical protein